MADFALGRIGSIFRARAYLMGVVNLSPDSWYRESVALDAEAAVAARARAARAGRGDHRRGRGIVAGPRGAGRREAQQARLLPVVRELAGAGLCVSVETYHAEVAAARAARRARRC